jgi:actinin alpha
MEPEEEWEREGLLDPAWEKQQKKVRIGSFKGV